MAQTSHAFADWIKVEQFEDGMRVYADPASVTRAGDTAQATHLVRWAEPQVDEGTPPYQSTVVQTAYDCGDKLERYLASTSYAGPMGDGPRVLHDDNAAATWYTISDASMEAKLWAIACGVQ